MPGVAGHLAAYNTRRRAHLLGGVLAPVIVLTAAATSVLMLVGTDDRTLARPAPTRTPQTINLLNNVVVGMIVLFAAVVVVNAFAAVVAHREGRAAPALAARRHARAGRAAPCSPRPRIVAGVGVVLGLLASLATIVPFGIARHEGAGPRRPALAAGRWSSRASSRSPCCRPARAVRRTALPQAVREAAAMTDWSAMASPIALLLPIRSVSPAPVDERAPRRPAPAHRWSALVNAPARSCPALALAILSVLSVAAAARSASASCSPTSWCRPPSGSPTCTGGSAARCSASEIPSGYADTDGHGRAHPAGPRGCATRPAGATSASCGSRRPAGSCCRCCRSALLVAPVTHLVGAVVDGGVWWWLLVLLSGPLLLVWWLVTPALVRGRALAERSILGARPGRAARAPGRGGRRVPRAETLDHSAAEVRRIERDLHDGAQARIASVGMNVGLAEKLMSTDPEAAAALLREARETTVSALEDLRSVVRGIHPPALADRGLAGGLEALALPIPLPITVTVDAPALPPPVESAAYFAVAECLANTVKHADATRAWVRVRHDGEVLHLVVGDDGRGGADPAGSGLAGVAKRLAAFDGTMVVDSPAGGPTVVTMEVPCPTSPL